MDKKVIDISMPSGAILASHTYNTNTTGPEIVYSDTLFPEQPLGQRLFVRFKDIPDGYEKVESKILGVGTMYKPVGATGNDQLISEENFAKILKDYTLSPQLVTVMAVGDMKDTGIKVGDTIRVYINQCEAKVKVGELEYLVYSERTVISKVI